MSNMSEKKLNDSEQNQPWERKKMRKIKVFVVSHFFPFDLIDWKSEIEASK